MFATIAIATAAMNVLHAGVTALALKKYGIEKGAMTSLGLTLVICIVQVGLMVAFNFWAALGAITLGGVVSIPLVWFIQQRYSAPVIQDALQAAS